MPRVRAIGTKDPVIRVLAVTPFKQDHETLAVMLTNPKWIVLKARPLTSARTKLRTSNSIPVVLCERDLAPESWRETLEYLRRMDEPPLLIVTYEGVIISGFPSEPVKLGRTNTPSL